MLTRYLLPLLSVVAFTFAVLQMTKAQQKPPTANPPVDPGKSPFGKQVAGAGIVEPETENISVGTHLPGVLKTVTVRVDDRVKPGALLFELDDRQLSAELAVRTAALDSARAQERKLLAMPRPEELPPYRAREAEAKANFDDKVKMFERAKKAAISSAPLSDEDYSSRFMGVEVSRAQLDRARADLALASAPAWEFDKKVSAAAVLQAQSLCDQTETELKRLKVLAPQVRRPNWNRIDPSESELVEFKVLQVNVRPGEFVGATAGQALIVLGTVGRLHVRVDIDENDISRFSRGMKGVANPRGNPDRKFPISFVRVEPYVIPKRSLTGGNTERVDTRVLQVIYSIDATDAPLFVGQQLDVSLQVE